MIRLHRLIISKQSCMKCFFYNINISFQNKCAHLTQIFLTLRILVIKFLVMTSLQINVQFSFTKFHKTLVNGSYKSLIDLSYIMGVTQKQAKQCIWQFLFTNMQVAMYSLTIEIQSISRFLLAFCKLSHVTCMFKIQTSINFISDMTLKKM